jgi:multiple sugar transport system substrate-binding protein
MSPSPHLSRRQLLRSALLAGGLGAAAATAGCGTGSGTQALAADSPTSLKGASLKLMVNQPHVVAFRDLLGPAFRKEFGGTLHVTAIPYDQLTSKQILDVQGGAGEFDVFDYFYFGLGALVDAGALVDLTKYIGAHADLDTADFLPSVYDPYTLLDGKRYGLPFDGDTHVLYYNTEILDRFGLQPPRTWDEYDQVAKAVTQQGGGAVYGAAVEGQQVPMILGCSFINRLAGYGGTLVDADGNPTLTSDAATAALQHLVDVAPSALPTPLQVGFDEANTAFLSGTAAMIDTWTDLGLKAQDPANSKIKDKWGVVPLPVGGANTTPRTALNSGFGLGVSTASSKAEQAAAFVAWATDRTRNLLLAKTGGSGIDPARTSVLSSPEYAAASAPATSTIAAGLTGDPLVWPRDAKAPKRLQDLVDQLALALQGEQDVATSLRKAQDSWEREVGS